jgi:hypothetical protein
MTIEVLEEREKEMTYFTREAHDRTESIKILEGIHETLINAGFGEKNDEKIINLDNYSDVPKEYLEGEPFKSNKSNVTHGSSGASVGQFATPANRYHKSNNSYTRDTTIQKEPEPAIFEMTKNKKPTREMLEAMAAKVAEVMAGTYQPQLPEILDKQDDEDDVTNDSIYSNLYNYGGYH